MLEQAGIVRGEDEGEAEAAVEIVHEVDELGGIFGVEVGGGLVGEHQGRTMNDGAGYGDALTFAAGEQIGAMAGAGGEADAFKGSGYAGAALGCGDALDQQREFDVFSRGEDGDEVEGLKDESDFDAAEGGEARRAEFGCIDTLDEDAAGGGLVDATDEVEQRGLAAAAGAGDGQELAGGDVEAGVAQGADKAMVKWEVSGDCFDADKFRLGRSLS